MQETPMPTPYNPEQLDAAVRALMEELSGSTKTNTVESNVRAAAAMLHKLGSFSGGSVIAGCCTQGCCDAAVLKILS